MAVITNVSDSYAVKVNSGINPSTGDVIEKSVSFPKVVTSADADKVLAIVDDLEDCLEYPVYEVLNTVVDYISAS